MIGRAAEPRDASKAKGTASGLSLFVWLFVLSKPGNFSVTANDGAKESESAPDTWQPGRIRRRGRIPLAPALAGVESLALCARSASRRLARAPCARANPRSARGRSGMFEGQADNTFGAEGNPASTKSWLRRKPTR